MTNMITYDRDRIIKARNLRGAVQVLVGLIADGIGDPDENLRRLSEAARELEATTHGMSFNDMHQLDLECLAIKHFDDVRYH